MAEETESAAGEERRKAADVAKEERKESVRVAREERKKAIGVAKQEAKAAGKEKTPKDKSPEPKTSKVKDPGFILFILGLLTFAFRGYLNDVTVAVFIGTVFMFISALYIFKGKSVVMVTIFWVWYVFFGGITDPRLLMYYLGPIIIVGMLVHGLFTKISKRDTFINGAGGELVGLIPILFFFLDLGLIPLLVETFNLPLTQLVKNLILFTPWWALLGAFTAQPAEGEKIKNFLVTIAKFGMVIWILSIFTFGVAPEAYDTYKSVTGPEEFLRAKEEIMGKIPETENPTVSSFACAIESIFNPSESLNTNECIENRQITYMCKQKEEVKSGGETLDVCKTEEKERRKEAALQIAGTDDPTIKEPTKAEFEISEYFPKTTYQARYPYPIQLEIENPRELELDFDIHCFFKKGRKNVTGTVEPQRFTVSKEKDIKNIACTPNNDLNGTYTLVYQANIYNMTTLSRLTRLFIGDINEKTEEEIEELKITYVPGKQYLSRAPKKEFAWINFGFGEPETNPLIEYDDKPRLISTIENTGGGRILAINNYHIDLEKEGITPIDKWECFSVTAEKIQELNYFLPKMKTSFKQTVPLTSCFIEIPEDLMNPVDYFHKEFTATLEYDYQIEKDDIKIEVKLDLIP